MSLRQPLPVRRIWVCFWERRMCWSVILEMWTIAGNSWFEDLPSSSPRERAESAHGSDEAGFAGVDTRVCVCVGILLSMTGEDGKRTSDTSGSPVFQEHMGQARSLPWAGEVPWPGSEQTGGREGEREGRFSPSTHKTSSSACLWAQVPVVSL